MKVKIYISDEGYGHIVRQRALVEELLILMPDLHITIQTEKHFDFAKANVKASKCIKKFNNIIWHKSQDGSPDVNQIENYYANYKALSEKFIEEELKDFAYDFIITDLNYEAFEVAQIKGVPSFGVAHFMWDWFFSELNCIDPGLLKQWENLAKTARHLFFPPFTPAETLEKYKSNVYNVPFIVKKNIDHKDWPDYTRDRIRILLMDSGAGLMKEPLLRALSKFDFANHQSIVFGLPPTLKLYNEHVYNIPEDALIVDYVKDADLVIGRPGFNTISECISFGVPMLLICENQNPEMEHNIFELNQRNLGVFMDMNQLQNDFSGFINNFIDTKLLNYKRAISEDKIGVNGAQEIAQKIFLSLNS